MNRLIAVGMLVLAAACNTNQLNQIAPEIAGGEWTQAGGGTTAPVLSERWTLVEFFSPT